MADVAAPRKGIRWRYVIVALLCAVAIGWMITLMQRNVVFFKTVSAAVADQADDGTRAMRVGGGVVPGSIQERGDGVDFQLTEGGQTIVVHHVGGEPSLFKDCAPVVAEGHWAAAQSTTFNSTRLLIKHGNDYEAPKNGTGTCPEDPAGR